MKWSLDQSQNGSIHLTVNGKRAVSRNGQENEVVSVGTGYTSKEIWFKFDNEGPRKHMDRAMFDCSFSAFSQKFLGLTSNGEFLNILADAGISINKRLKKSGSKPSTTVFTVTNKDVVSPQPLEIPENLQALQSKYAGEHQIAITQLTTPPSHINLREVDGRWVNRIKKTIQDCPGHAITKIPVLRIREGNECMDLKLEKFYALGGNHLLKAVSDLLLENQENPNVDCLRHITCDVYQNLTSDEALFVSCWHNRQSQHKDITLQDKVRVARNAYLTNCSEWKTKAAETLGFIEGKDYTQEGLSTVLSVAAYSAENYKLVLDIFSTYDKTDDGKSFPRNLFRNLQSMDNEQRTAYLAKAPGTNGMKVAQMIVDDKRRENMKQIITTTLQENTFAEVNEKYGNVEKMLEYTGDISTAVGKHKFAAFISHLSENIVPRATLELLINGEKTIIPKDFQAKINKLEKEIEMFFSKNEE